MIPRRALPALLAAGAARAADWAGLGRRCADGIAARLPPGGAPVLLASWDTQGAPAAFARVNGPAAFTYDNALAGIALLAHGDVAGASRIGTALALNQQNDRSRADGRLRNAYAAGAPTGRLPGWWDGAWREDAYHVGSATGVVAFAMLLWGQLAARTGDRAWTEPMRRAGAWVTTTQRRDRGFAGGVFGHEPVRQEAWVSTEHNADLEAAFAMAAERDAAAHAARFVDAMWEPRVGRFLTGLLPDGRANAHPALDANVWPLLARPRLFSTDRVRALDWVRAQHGVGAAFDFDADRDGGWTEGTAFTALALRRTGQDAAVTHDWLVARMTPTGWLAASDIASLTTGLSTGVDPSAADFRYPRLPHLGATAWAALAGAGFNPFAVGG